MTEQAPGERVRVLAAVMDGDLRALKVVRSWTHDELRAVAGSTTTLWLSPEAVVSVLRQLDDGAPPHEVQLWASFVLHGFAEGVGSGPITPIDIEFDEAAEQTMVDALVRLDEIGDLIDGEVTHDEIVRLIDSLA